MSALSPGVAGLRWSDVALGLAALLCLVAPNTQLPSLLFPRAARTVIVGIALVAAGSLLGDLRAGSTPGQLIETLRYPVIAVAPMLCLLLVRADRSLRTALASAFTAGVVVSTIAGAMGMVRSTSGRWEGLTTHPNQLGMTAAMALALLPLLLDQRKHRRWWRVGCGLWLGVTILQTGSRSAAVAAGAVLVIYLCNWARRRPGRAAAPLLAAAGCGLVLLGFSINPLDETNTGQRVSSGEVSSSDAAREELLGAGLAGITLDNVVLGAGGTFFERSPHNVALELLVTGGFLAFGGFAIVFLPPSLRGFGVAFSRRRPTERQVYALATTAFVIAILFNNALWARYPWVVLALYVLAEDTELEPTTRR